MHRLYQVIFTRTDRDSLPAGAAIGFATTVEASDAAHANTLAGERLARLSDGPSLFIERITDVTVGA
jgi:hypothetical protein